MNRVFVIIGLVFLLIGCVQKVDRDPNGFDEQKIIQACEQIIDEFQGTLKQHLVKAMAEGSPENAIGVCHTIAPNIADSFSNMAGFEIRRVSLKQRNQQMLPDGFEVKVLEQFAGSEVSEPQIYSEMVIDSGKIKHFRYLKEIKIGQVCLRCHGAPENFAEGLKETLATNYPDDKATGYNIGDSRGAFSVYVRYPDAKPTITELLSENGR